MWANRDFVRLWAASTVSDFGSLVTRTALPFAAVLLLDAIEQLYVVEFLAGAMTMIFAAAYQVYLPTLVPREDLVRANSVLRMVPAVALAR